MPLDPVLRETLEFLQGMLRARRVTAHSRNFGLLVHLIDMALLEATAERDAGAGVTGKCGKGRLSATRHSQVMLH
jgi:hypothetical protein